MIEPDGEALPPPDDPAREYVLGTHDDEVERLGLQHRAWRGPAYALWDHAGFGPGQTLIDLGSGPGHATLDLAHLVGPSGAIVAVDQSRRFLEHIELAKRALGLHWIRTVECDVQSLDLPSGAADGAYTRWVFSFVPDPEAVVAGVAQALKPGGVFALQEYVYYRAFELLPPDPIVDRIKEAVDRSFRNRGSDPDTAGRLPGILSRHGFEVTTLRPLNRLARPGTMLWQWPTSFFENYLPLLVRGGDITAAEEARFFEVWRARAADPNAFFLTPPMVEIVATRRAATVGSR